MGWIGQRILGKVSGPPPMDILPDFVFHAYNLTHSLVVWSALFALIWALRRHPPWLFLAWGLHVLCPGNLMGDWLVYDSELHGPPVGL